MENGRTQIGMIQISSTLDSSKIQTFIPYCSNRTMTNNKNLGIKIKIHSFLKGHERRCGRR